MSTLSLTHRLAVHASHHVSQRQTTPSAAAAIGREILDTVRGMLMVPTRPAPSALGRHLARDIGLE